MPMGGVFMPRKGLSGEDILEAALDLIQEEGYASFSLRALSKRLLVQPASLYNHVEGLTALTEAVASRVALDLKAELEQAAAGLPEPEAFRAALLAYRRFAQQKPELYKALMDQPQRPQTVQSPAFHEILRPIHRIVLARLPQGDQALHYMRTLRAGLHGFVCLEAAGFMNRGRAAPQESYDFFIRSQWTLLQALCQANGATAEKE